MRDEPGDSGLNEWMIRCSGCSQVTTTWYDPAGDGWIKEHILSAHKNCKWWHKHKRRLFKLIG